jgi:tetratricopeptide (TPR) repeat protein
VPEAKKTFEEGLREIGPDPELHFCLTQIASDEGDLAVARSHYEACLRVETSTFYSSFDRGIQGFKTLHNLAGVELAAGDYPKAKELFLEALQSAPEFLPSAFCLFDAALARNDRATMIEMLEWVRAKAVQSPNWEAMRSRLP